VVLGARPRRGGFEVDVRLLVPDRPAGSGPVVTAVDDSAARLPQPGAEVRLALEAGGAVVVPKA